jgi:predicted amidophosphoribosyltransferase
MSAPACPRCGMALEVLSTRCTHCIDALLDECDVHRSLIVSGATDAEIALALRSRRLGASSGD